LGLGSGSAPAELCLVCAGCTTTGHTSFHDFEGSGIEEAEEGQVIIGLHRRHERCEAIVKTKKARALAKYDKLACEACEQQRYGDAGPDTSSVVTRSPRAS
jgi:hypothetical protein